jgi:hypothetical protein
MTETGHRSAERFNKRNRFASAKNRPRQFIQTPQGNTLASDFIEPLANFLAGKLDVQPDLPPKSTGARLRRRHETGFLGQGSPWIRFLCWRDPPNPRKWTHQRPFPSTARRSAERFNDRNRLANAKNRPRPPVQ